ncbi:MAG: hypothetical protein ABJA90_08885, partial [Ginsengibacter sp.]
IFLILSCASCKKSIENSGNSFYIESFRKPGMDDYETLMAAYDSVPDHSKLFFAPKTYTFGHTPIINKSLGFFGPATIKREDQIVYTLKEPANANSSVLVLNYTKGINASDRFFLTFGQSHEKNSLINTVIKVSGDTLFLNNPLDTTEEGIGTYDIGTKLFKSINFFFVLTTGSSYEEGCSFNDLLFDGNRDHNQGSYSWRLNSAILTETKTTTLYRHSKFINSPGETIVGHNADIRNCTFYNLNGSAFHTSADRLTSAESEIHSYLSDNLFENTNQVLNSVGGHSEGTITHSNSGGYYTATKNTFINVGEAVLGTLYPSVSIHDWGTSDITFTGNTINGAGNIVQSVAVLPGTIHDVRIEKNSISNVVAPASSYDLAFWPNVIVKTVSGQ